MSRANAKLSDVAALVSSIDPASQSVGSVTGTAVDLQKFNRVLFVLKTGVLGTSATVDYAVYSDSASGGSFTNLVRGITQIVKASGDNKQAFSEIRGADISALGHRYVRDKITVGVAASIVESTAIGYETRFDPSDGQAASVVQIASY